MQSGIMYWFAVGIFCFSFLQITPQGTPTESPYYVGAVVDYHPILRVEGSENVVNVNVANYITIIKKAKELNSKLDIIVFPESGLPTRASYVPDPIKKVTPCGDKNTKVSKTLESLSCAAKKYQTYLVVNQLEKEDCTNCASNNLNIYNSNVVFDRFGTIVARYRKYNLYMEIGLNVTSEYELSTFETDFGVKFGQFICMDILYGTPALRLVKKLNVTDIVFPTHWYSELPFLDELQVQAAWSYANNVNLLASGLNFPSLGSTGSGIYAGRYDKILGTYRSETNENALLIANVPKVKDGIRRVVKNETLFYEFSNDEMPIKNNSTVQNKFKKDITLFGTKLLGSKVKEHLTLCEKSFCCYFDYQVEYNMSVVHSGEEYYRYRFAAFNGTRIYGFATAGIQTCGLMACTNDSFSSCGRRFDRNDTFRDCVTFQKLEISTLFPRRKNVSLFNMPVSLQTNYQPLNPEDYTFKETTLNNDEYDYVYLNLERTQKHLMSFGIYGRNISADRKQEYTW